MIGQDPGWIDLTNPGEGFWKSSGTGVESGGRQRSASRVASKEITGKQEVMFDTVESAVTSGVTGEMNHLQAAPEGKFLRVCERSICGDRLVS